ncbi:MAG TPA: ribonuclease HI family protein [Terracidiphilus sp.]
MSDSLFPESAPTLADQSRFFTAHCDGGSRGNPGPAAYGAVIEDPHGRIVARLSEYLGHRTNNYAEYQGLLAVLAWAAEHRATRLRVVSDSELMVRQMKGAYKVSSPALRPLWEEARRRAAALERFEIRHTLRAGNQEADRLANEAMDRGMGKSSAKAPNPAATQPELKPRVLDGYVKNGVVHLLDGELPDGAFVKVTLK